MKIKFVFKKIFIKRIWRMFFKSINRSFTRFYSAFYIFVCVQTFPWLPCDFNKCHLSESPANVAIRTFVQIRHLIPGRLICKYFWIATFFTRAIYFNCALSVYDLQCQFTRRFLTIRATRENVVLLNEYSSRVAFNQHVSRPRTTLIETDFKFASWIRY